MQNRPTAYDSAWVPKFIKVMSQANVKVYRATNGRVWGKWRVGAAFPRGVPLCLLTHTGRKSGREFTTPLLYLKEGDSVALVASQGGLPDHPQWYYNVLANPIVTVQIGGDVRRMRATVADEPTRARLWPKLVELYADFENYQSWTDRVIQVVVCEPA